jgi:hypothetical protein
MLNDELSRAIPLTFVLCEDSVLVGDFSSNNNLFQKPRNVSKTIGHPDEDLLIVKIEPVTLPGFAPAALSTKLAAPAAT